jgi:hypothetical protein
MERAVKVSAAGGTYEYSYKGTGHVYCERACPLTGT